MSRARTHLRASEPGALRWDWLTVTYDNRLWGKTMYSIVDSADLEAFIVSRGEFGKRIGTHQDFGSASVEAETVADDYHYGVEIVDEEVWEIVDVD